jgi:glycosyltransferase involved in cell wall biosynthesis
MRICFVVHRYAPFPGGSEYYVQQMAEECVQRHHDVTVFAGEHKGHLNGVRVTSNPQDLLDLYDLVVVHGGDVGVQNFVLQNAKNIPSPILYMLIKPSESPTCLQALKDVDYIGCSAPEDWEHVKKHGVQDKSYKVIHGISPTDCIGEKGQFKSKYKIPENKRMFLSCGGYWPNKKMIELANALREANLTDSILVTTGYDNSFGLMPHASENVIPLMVEDPRDVKDAIADADCYIMNSDSEGFGLVVLESMINRTPWIARNIAGAKLLSEFGSVYETEQELVELLRKFNRNEDLIKKSYECVINHHLIKNTVDDIFNIINSR